MQNIIKEQIRKRVARSGNSGAVWVPKNWLGEEIIVTRLETPKQSLEEEIIHLFLPYLKSISGIFLYGSYAKNEETKDSDIDILIIAKNKFKTPIAKNFDIDIIEYKKVKQATKQNPFVFSIIKESKPLFNTPLLEELQKTPLKQTRFKPFIKWFITTTKDQITSTRKFIELDKLDSEYILSHSTVYSTILRLRGLFLIKSLRKNKLFSNKDFKNWITKTLPKAEYKKIYTTYRNIRDKKTLKEKDLGRIKTSHLESLVDFLEKEIKDLRW